MSEALGSDYSNSLLEFHNRDALWNLDGSDFDFDVASTVLTDTTYQNVIQSTDPAVSRKRKKNFRVLIFVGFCIFFDMFIFVPSVRPYIHHVNEDNGLATTDTLFAVSRCVFSLSQTLILPLCSYVIAKTGKTKLLLIIFVLFYLLGNILYILAYPLKSVGLILVARLFSGIGACSNRLFFQYLNKTQSREDLVTEFSFFRYAMSISLILGACLNAFIYPLLSFDLLSLPINFMSAPALTSLALFTVSFFLVILVYQVDELPVDTTEWKISPPPLDINVLYIIFMNFSAQFVVEWQLYCVTTTTEGLYNWTAHQFSVLFLIMAVFWSFFSNGTKAALHLNYFKSTSPMILSIELCGMLVALVMMYFGHRKGPDTFSVANVFAYAFYGVQGALLPDISKNLVQVEFRGLLEGWTGVICGVGRVIAPISTDILRREFGEFPEYSIAVSMVALSLLFTGLLWFTGRLGAVQDRFFDDQDSRSDAIRGPPISVDRTSINS